MSVQSITWVQCDGCGDSLMGETEDARNAAEARADARGLGYHLTRAGHDVCPGCWERGVR